MSTKFRITTPVGRLVGGSLYQGRDKNDKGVPFVFKSGPNIGQPRTEYAFGVAFAKTPGATHWANEQWLKPIWDFGHAAHPQGQAQHRDFSWKIEDGDSIEPNKKGKKNSDREGWPGHWVIWFKDASKAPKICDATGQTSLTERDLVKPGYYVQVYCEIDKNNSDDSPGLFVQPIFVAYAASGVEIVLGPDASSAGFGQAPLPAGAAPALMPGAAAAPGSQRVMTAKAGTFKYEDFIKPGSTWTDEMLIKEGYMLAPAPAPLPSAPGSAIPPAAPAPAPLPSAPGPAPTAPAPGLRVPVMPNPAMAQLPVPGAAPAMPAPVPAAPAPMPSPAPARTMTAKANGWTYEQLIATGQWTDATLIQNGLMLG